MRQSTWRIRWSAGALTALLTTAAGLYLHRLQAAWAGLAGLFACVLLADRLWRRLDAELADLRQISDGARMAFLRRTPWRRGAVHVTARYLAASRYGGVGGDFYDVADTPYGIRVIIGDVKGHGLDAFGLAADVVAVFRELIRHEPSLAGVAGRLDAHVASRLPECPEDFVTALLLQIPAAGDVAELVCCGHPVPLLLRGGSVLPPGSLPRDPPLGLLRLGGTLPGVGSLPFAPGDRLLMYTDGATEARAPNGAFFPLVDRVARLAEADPEPDAEVFLARLEEAVRRHAHGRLADDLALLMLGREPARSVLLARDQPAVRDQFGEGGQVGSRPGER